jgi:hypothetical protein
MTPPLRLVSLQSACLFCDFAFCVGAAICCGRSSYIDLFLKLARFIASKGQSEPMNYWEIIANRLHAEGWSYGIAEHLTKHGLLFCVDAHRDGKRFIVKADDLLAAFLSLERDAIAPKGANGNATHENVA